MLLRDRRIGLAAGAAAAVACLAPGAAEAEPWRFRDALAYAREHAPRVEARRAERDRVRAESHARGFFLPEAPGVGGEWADREAPGAETDDRLLEASLTIEPFGQGIFRARAAGAGRRLGLADVDARARTWAAELAWRYYERLRRDWLHERTLRQASVTQRLASVTERRFEAGDTSGLELDLARIEAAESGRRVFESEIGAREAEEALAAAIGWPAGTPLPEADSLDLVPAFPDTARLLDRALERRPELVTARATLDLGAAESRLAQARLLPEAELGYFDGHEGEEEIRGIRVALSVPFLGPELRERGARAAERRRLASELDAATREAVASVATATAAAGLAYQQVALYERDILPTIQAARQRYEKAYTIGELDFTTLLLSEQRYRDAERGFAEALASYLDSLRNLEVATGVPVLSGYELDEEVKP